MTYSVKEVFYTLQGEGSNAGRAAVFCRFTGCNLWSGREADRAEAKCKFCDTDFVGTDGVGGGKFETASGLAEHVRATWKGKPSGHRPLVVCTGGEPLLQIDENLIGAIHDVGFDIAVETNGTCLVPDGIDWVCVSPKEHGDLIVSAGQELKVVFPQPRLDFEALARLEFQHFFVQPMDGLDQDSNTNAAIAFCLDNPQWRLSVQTHKVVGID